MTPEEVKVVRANCAALGFNADEKRGEQIQTLTTPEGSVRVYAIGPIGEQKTVAFGLSHLVVVHVHVNGIKTQECSPECEHILKFIADAVSDLRNVGETL